MKITEPFIGMEVVPPNPIKASLNCFISEIGKTYVIVDVIDSEGKQALTPQTMIKMEDLTKNWRAK
jgi:hypothetical protein